MEVRCFLHTKSLTGKNHWGGFRPWVQLSRSPQCRLWKTRQCLQLEFVLIVCSAWTEFMLVGLFMTHLRHAGFLQGCDLAVTAHGIPSISCRLIHTAAQHWEVHMNSIDSDPFLHCTQKFKFHNIREPAHSFNSFRIQLSINDVYTYRHMICILSHTASYCRTLFIYMISQRTQKNLVFGGIALDVFVIHPYPPQRPLPSPPWSFLEHQTWQLHPGSMGIMAKTPLWAMIKTITLQGINISHLGNRKIIFKMPFLGDMLVPWRVLSLKIRFLLLKIGWLEDEISFSGWTICRGLSC